VNVRVLIADDQALVRSGFRKLLEAEAGIERAMDRYNRAGSLGCEELA